MEKSMIKINYLYNSAFKIETEKHVFIFDYYLDSTETGVKNCNNGAIGESDLRTDKKIIVFCSHSHGDHFSDIIFSWKNIRADIKYVLSSDIELKEKDENITVLSPYEEALIENTYIKAYGSTDIGISFLIKADGINIFHAGDLNWWHWYDESDKDNKQAEKAFKEEIKKIKGENIDVAFFPVDSRLRESYALGPEYFIKEIEPKNLIPMHFREDYDITDKFSERNKNRQVRIFKIARRGEEILLNI